MDEEHKKRGFAGLDSLTSDISQEVRKKARSIPANRHPAGNTKASHDTVSAGAGTNHDGGGSGYPGTAPISGREDEQRQMRQPTNTAGWAVILGIVGLIGFVYWATELSYKNTEAYKSPGRPQTYKNPRYSSTKATPPRPSVIQGTAQPLDKRGICELQELLGEMGLYTSTVDGISGPGTRRAIAKLMRDYPSANKYGPTTRVLQYARSAVFRIQARDGSTAARVSLPKNGKVFSRRSYGKAPFKISTSAGENYYVKLVDKSNGGDVVTFFVRGGQSVELEVPYGTYSLRYASGHNWYGKTCLFGRNTTFFEADKTLRFYVNGYQVVGHRVELIKQINGNMSSRSISADRF